MQPIVIPDLHGFSSYLEAVLRQHPDRNFIFLGDYVDRGPDSRGVLEHVRALVEQGRAVALKGNHDDMMIDALLRNDMQCMSDWLRNGGHETQRQMRIKELHDWAVWMDENLKPWTTSGGVFLSHAMRPEDYELPEQGNLHLWGRPQWKVPGPQGDHQPPLPAGCDCSVHGHSISEGPVIDFTECAIYIDLGPGKNHRLCTLDLETGTFEVYTTKPLHPENFTPQMTPEQLQRVAAWLGVECITFQLHPVNNSHLV